MKVAGGVTVSQIASASAVGLDALHIRFDTGWRHQPNIMTGFIDFWSPVVGPALKAAYPGIYFADGG